MPGSQPQQPQPQQPQAQPAPENAVKPPNQVAFGAGGIAMPPPQTDSNGKPISVLGDADRAAMWNKFQELWKNLEENPPTVGQYNNNVEDFLAANNAYKNNPLWPLRERALEQYNTVRVGGGNDAQANKAYQISVQQSANDFMNGFDRAVDDPSLNANRQSAFQKIMHGDFTGALKSFVLSIPWVGERVIALQNMAFTFINSKFDPNVKAVGFDESLADLRRQRSLAGAAAALGLDQNSAESLIREGFKAFAEQNNSELAAAAPVANDSPKTTSISVPRIDIPAAFDKNYSAPNGSSVGAPKAYKYAAEGEEIAMT